MQVSERTLKILSSTNQKANLICGYNSNQIINDFNNLIKGVIIEVGYRSSCGKTDKTHKVFREWLKVLKSLKKDGIVVNEVNVVHPNKSPTLAIGFWNSIIYSCNYDNTQK